MADFGFLSNEKQILKKNEFLFTLFQVEELKNEIVDCQENEEEMEKEMHNMEERMKESEAKAENWQREANLRDAMLEDQKPELERLYGVEADYHEVWLRWLIY